MDAPTAAVIIGGLITAAGTGVVITTKWFSNAPAPGETPPNARLSWATVAVGLLVLAAAVVMLLVQHGATNPGGDGGGGRGGISGGGGG